MTCADGSPVKPQFLGGAGLCGREESEDVPCLGPDYVFTKCMDDQETCSSCDIPDLYSNFKTCTPFYDDVCHVVRKCCPECAEDGKKLLACVSSLEDSFDDNYFTTECLSNSECSTDEDGDRPSE